MPAEQRLILRAEISLHGRSFVGHTMEICESGAFLRTEEPANVGDRLVVRLSFPELVDPFELEAHVVSRRVATAPGDPVGTTVAFVFRSDEESARLAALLDHREPSPRARANAAAYRILLVDDSQVIREMFVFGMRKYFGARHTDVLIDVAAGAAHGWAQLRAGSYDLAIIDYYLPGQNGAALVRQIRADATLARLPVIAISVGGREAHDAFLAAGADLYLDKPVVLRDLCATLERLTRKWAAA